MRNLLRDVARRILRPPLHKPDVDFSYELLGHKYAGFPVLRDTTPGSLVYSFGMGVDISFELAAIDRFRCVVHGFDPTPKSIEWLESQELPSGFQFHKIGIGGQDAEVEFFPPDNPDHVSYSINPHHVGEANTMVKSPVMRLESIIDKLETGVPEIVRMNVEGFEYPFVENFVQSSIRPRQLVIEFHHRMYGIKKHATLEAVKKLRDVGYQIFYTSNHGRDYGFIFQS